MAKRRRIGCAGNPRTPARQQRTHGQPTSTAVGYNSRPDLPPSEAACNDQPAFCKRTCAGPGKPEYVSRTASGPASRRKAHAWHEAWRGRVEYRTVRCTNQRLPHPGAAPETNHPRCRCGPRYDTLHPDLDLPASRQPWPTDENMARENQRRLRHSQRSPDIPGALSTSARTRDHACGRTCDEARREYRTHSAGSRN